MLVEIQKRFRVKLAESDRWLDAKGWVIDGKQPTRFTSMWTVAVRYRTGNKLHKAGIEFETDPEQLDKLQSYGWRRGEGFVWRVSGFRSHGNYRSVLIPVGWADQFSPERFA